MTYNYSVETISCDFSGRHFMQVYRLSNNAVLRSDERDSNGNYYGGIGMDGIFLRTSATYRPVYNIQNELCAFERIEEITA